MDKLVFEECFGIRKLVEYGRILYLGLAALVYNSEADLRPLGLPLPYILNFIQELSQ